MKVYYANNEYGTGKNAILAVNYDRDDFAWKNTINIPYSVLVVDEVAPENKDTCLDLISTLGKCDEFGESKYFVGMGNLCENEGWIEYVTEA